MKIDTYSRSVLTVIALCLAIQVAEGWATPRPVYALQHGQGAGGAQGGQGAAGAPAGQEGAPLNVTIVGVRIPKGQVEPAADDADARPWVEAIPVNVKYLRSTNIGDLIGDTENLQGGPVLRVGIPK